MDRADLMTVAEQSEQFLCTALNDDWNTPIPDMEWTVAEAVAHMCESPLWYAFDLSAGETQLDTLTIAGKADSTLSELIATLRATTRVLASVVSTSDPADRGAHPFGLSDASGYIAMACAEILIHTDDAARGLGRSFEGDPDIAVRLLAQLMRLSPEGQPAWDVLRWAHGRMELPDRPRPERWRWYLHPVEAREGAESSSEYAGE
jgi:uncharacterized protein (TIGR03083 family)